MQKVLTPSFFKAKNGLPICKVGEILLHSCYDPQKQAQRFVENVSCNFEPAFVVITEPALCYCLAPLKKRFPRAKYVCIRYTKDFFQYNTGFDYVIQVNSNAKDETQNIENTLFSLLTEEGVARTLFLSWEPSQNAFPFQNAFVWQAIKQVALKAQAVMNTRSYFSSVWLKNVFKFCAFLGHPLLINKGTCDILVTAAGGSLEESLPFIKQNRKHFFLVALSSSILPLLHSGITADLYLSCDGGYWAKKHLLPASNVNAPFAFALEAAVPQDFLFSKQVLPLCYNDGLETQLAFLCGIKPFFAMRCGTVAGVALQFALNLTQGNIYFCGLDLYPSKSHNHARPNALDLLHTSKYTMLNTGEAKGFLSGGQAGAFDIYANWFKDYSKNCQNRVFRIGDKSFCNDLGDIKDIKTTCVSFSRQKIDISLKAAPSLPTIKDRQQRLLTFLRQKQNYDSILQALCPAYNLSKKDKTDITSRQHAFSETYQKFLEKVKRFLI